MDVNKRIKTVEELFDILDGVEEIILYGAGGVTRDFVKNIKILRKDYNVLCIAVKRMDANVSQIMNVPVEPLCNLSLFYKKALFLVTTKEGLHDEIVGELKKQGCVNIKTLSEQVFDELQRAISSDMIQDFFVQETYKMTECNRYRVEQQNEICHVNTESFAEYKNCNRGKDVVLIGTGPTLSKYKPIEDAIHIGVNGACRRDDIKFDYYFIQDFDRRYSDNSKFLRMASGQIFIARYLQEFVNSYFEAPVDYGFIHENTKYYYLDADPTLNIYPDICFHPLMNYASVTFPALHFALYTYPKRIYLVGCDIEGKHFYDVTKKTPELSLDVLKWKSRYFKLGYSRMKTFADHFYPETEIISINPVGLKGLFKDEIREG